jgi:hypothetical protein
MRIYFEERSEVRAVADGVEYIRSASGGHTGAVPRTDALRQRGWPPLAQAKIPFSITSKGRRQ